MRRELEEMRERSEPEAREARVHAELAELEGQHEARLGQALVQQQQQYQHQLHQLQHQLHQQQLLHAMELAEAARSSVTAAANPETETEQKQVAPLELPQYDLDEVRTMNALLEQARAAVAAAKEEAARARAELASVQAAKERLEREAEACSEQRASAERREATVAQHFRRYVEMTEEEMQRPQRVEPRDAVGVGSPSEFRM